MGAPSDQFIHLIWRPRSLCIFFILYGGLSDHFFAYYIGAPRSLSSLTIWGPSGQFLLIQYGGPSQITFIDYYMPPPPQISFFACYRRATSDYISFTKYMGGPPRSVSLLTIWGPIRLVSLLSFIWGPLRSVSVHTFWGPLSDQFFLLLYGAPSDQFFSHNIWGAPQISFLAYYMWVP